MGPNPRLQRTPSAAPPSPLSRQPLGRGSPTISLARVGALAFLLAASHALAGQQPVHVVGMSVDPSLLERSGLTIGELKAAAVAQLKAAGIDADVQEKQSLGSPRLAMAVPVKASGEEIVAFILLQYQIAVRSEKAPGEPLYATTWSRWWGGTAKGQALASELKKGLKALVEQFIAASQEGEL